MKNVLVTLPINENHRTLLEASGTDCQFTYILPGESTAAQVQAADVIIGNVPRDQIGGSSRLGLLQLSSAGTDGYLNPGVLAEHTILANATGAYGKSVAEHMFSMLLMLQKKLHLYRDDRINGAWLDHGSVSALSHSTVLIIGLGDIGTHFARLVKNMGAHVIGIKRRPSVCPDGVDELHLMSELDTVLPAADVVFSILPNTAATQGLYNKDFFAKMKPSAIFLNGGRGNAVNQDDLLTALQNRTIQSAGIDVTVPEPLPADSPLWQEPNLLITPHVSGSFHLADTMDQIIAIAAANLKAYLTGEPVKNIIDSTTGYCK